MGKRDTMTEKVISDFITPSEEITTADGEISSAGLLDEVNLYNLYDDRESPEQNAQRILEITYPTETLTTIIKNTARTLNGDDEFTEGGQIIGGGYGSGKSHIELVIYHLFNSPSIGQDWLDQQGIEATLPDSTRAAALQMFNLDTEYNLLSEAVADHLGIETWEGDTRLPTVHQIRDTLEGVPTLVLLDEFERWFGMADRAEYREDNKAFLQNLLEAAGRDDTQLSVFLSLLYENDDVQAVAQRTNPFTYDLSSRRDEKIDFLLHRLVGSVDDPPGIGDLAKEYTNVYRQNDQIQLEDYQHFQDRIERYYPFHPMALDLLMEKYSEQRISSDARGLLKFLTQILADTYSNVDLILTGDIDVFDYADRFQYIDNELVGKYINDYHRLQNSDDSFDEYIEELINIVLLHSLARAGEEGANKRQILMGTMRKGINAHRIIQTFREDVYGHAWHIHRINGEYAFDTDENPAARIEKKARDIHKHDAIHRVESLVRRGLFDNHNNVYILDPVNTEQDIPDNKALKIVVMLNAKESYDEEFKALTTGQEREFHNTLALVTPGKRSSIDNNTGIIELARKVVAGEQLDREEEVLPEGFKEIHEQNKQNLHDRVRDKFGTVHRSTGRGLYPEDLPNGDHVDFYDATIDIVKPDYSHLKSEVEDAIEDAGAGGIQYEHLRNDFYRNTEYPTLTGDDELEDALDDLCRDGFLKAGNYFEERLPNVGNDTNLVHEKYVEEDDEDDETAEITIDTTGVTSAGDELDGDSTTGSPTATEGGSGGDSGVLECPQCRRELIGNTCECGFEFDASDVKEGKVTVEGATTNEILDEFGLDNEPSGPKTQSVPIMGTLEADNKPDMIDTLERKIGIEWDIHTATITVEGTLTTEDLEHYGIAAEALNEKVSVNETFEVEPDEPFSRQSFLSLVWDLNVPEHASLDVSMQVDKNE
ncbi:ATPase AAA [Halanaeroarchaeum sulfurireducens]|uniref:ATPase AAA n=2 Tax=Halanaeroarchaeum sulfurireducens TaxID=1604004 RepID=A0A0N9N536_9EURY|nr:ATPase AAA [Halanaeroarchaeum sulfurireducens]